MTNQPCLKITAQGIAPDWVQKVLPALKTRRDRRKYESRQVAERRDLITPKKVLEHFNTAERLGVWSR